MDEVEFHQAIQDNVPDFFNIMSERRQSQRGRLDDSADTII
jgi:hypothetical protein